jgi:hypothetical protein
MNTWSPSPSSGGVERRGGGTGVKCDDLDLASMTEECERKCLL